MISFWTLGPRSGARELIDGPLESRTELAESFGDIARANRRFGGLAAVRQALRPFSADTVLDVGCGSGDIARALRREYRTTGRSVTFTCIDYNRELLDIAQRMEPPDAGITYVAGDALHLPFDDGSFDVAMCNLTLHHFDPQSAVTLLRELRRVSRIAPVVTDLQRSLAAFAATYAFSRIFTKNRLTRHDGPLSARRAYTPHEALHLARSAGWRNPRVESFGIIRLVLSDAAAV